MGRRRRKRKRGKRRERKVVRRVVVPRLGLLHSFLPCPYVGPTAGMLAAQLCSMTGRPKADFEIG